MTFKEKLEIEHPNAVNEYYFGGCAKCPYSYGYEVHNKELCDSLTCDECWNREMPTENLTHEAYSKAFDECTEAVRKVFETSIEDLRKIFGTGIWQEIFNQFTMEEVVDRMERVNARVGDTVVYHGERAVVLEIKNDEVFLALNECGKVMQLAFEDVTKSDECIEVDEILRKVRG